MNRAIGLLFVLSAALALGAENADDVRKELTALEGTWKAVAMEAAGMPLPRDSMPPFTFIVAADGKATGKMSNGEYQATITVDPTKTPRTINNLHETGPSKGKTQYGIYELHGDTWTVCMTAPGAAAENRPRDFTTKGTANAVFVFERVKED